MQESPLTADVRGRISEKQNYGTMIMDDSSKGGYAAEVRHTVS